MAKDNEWQDALKAIRVLVALVGFVFLLLKFLLFSKSNTGAILSFLVLGLGLWAVREVAPPEIHVCDVCGLEYTYTDLARHPLPTYCPVSPSHKHHGKALPCFDFRHGLNQVRTWMKTDAESLMKAFEEEEEEGNATGANRNDG